MYLGLCTDCSNKLNYKHKKKEIKRNKVSKFIKHKSKQSVHQEKPDPQPVSSEQNQTQAASSMAVEDNVWSEQLQIEDDKPREDDFENYLEQLLF